MTFTHKRGHGGKSSPQLLDEAVALHYRLGEVVIANLSGAENRPRRLKAMKAMRRAYTRCCRRDVRLAIQEGR